MRVLGVVLAGLCRYTTVREVSGPFPIEISLGKGWIPRSRERDLAPHPAEPAMSPRVVLVGTMGAGKTTVGGLLAEAWGVGFRDTDQDVEATAGKSVQDIFVDEGEDEFRALERAAVADALADHDGVLALGGGAVLAEETRALLDGPPRRVPPGRPRRRRQAGRARACRGRCCSATSAAG